MPFFTPDQVEQLSRSTVRVGLLVEKHFKSQTVWLWNGNSVLDAGGREWKPTYGGMQVDGLGQSAEAVSQKVTITASGVDQTVLGMVLAETEEADQQPIVVLFQLFDDDWQPVGGLIPVFFGLMQPPRVSRTQMNGTEGATQTISLTAENAFYNRARPPYGRYTSLDQNKRTAMPDKFFDFMPSLFNKQFVYPDF